MHRPDEPHAVVHAGLPAAPTSARRTGLTCPQVVLRIGYGELVRPTPRRAGADLLALA